MDTVGDMNEVPVFKEINSGCVTWILLVQNLIQGRVSYEHGNESLGVIKGGGSHCQFSRNSLLPGVTLIVISDMS
jgi:hypothetical protein